MNEIINWIDKDLKAIENTELFLKYFEGIEIYNDELDYYLTNENKGIEIVTSTNFRINSIHFFAEFNNYKSFKDELPMRLVFSFQRDNVYELLGPANKKGGGHNDIYLGFTALWDKYYFDNYSLHIQYSKDNRKIEIITVASLKLEEYFNSVNQ